MEPERVEGLEVAGNDEPMFAKTTPSAPLSTRAIINNVETNDNDPNAGATTFSASGDQIRGDVDGYDIDWFKTLYFQNPSPSGKIYNISITPSSISIGSTNWLIVRLYTFWDFNDNNYIDEKELIMLHQESYSSSSSTWDTCWGSTSHWGIYYVAVEGSPSNPQTELDYQFSITWAEVSPPVGDLHYDITKAKPITPWTPVKNQYIDMDKQPFDWYVIEAPSDPDMFGVNVTIKATTHSPFPSIYADGIATSFVTEFCVVILHEQVNKPSGPYIYGGFQNVSKHKTTGLRKHVNYFDIEVWPEDTKTAMISRSYICFFAMTYGIYAPSAGIREIVYYDQDFTDDLEDDGMNTYVKYSITKIASDPVIRPVLNPVKVFSTRTKTSGGKTYDTYRYQIGYWSKANYEPIITRLYVYLGGNKQPLVRNLLPMNPENTNFNNIDSPAEYYFDMDGITLGIGTFKYQVKIWDRHTYAKYSKDDKILYDGPTVSNNIPPQVRQTAQITLEMMEDDKKVALKLNGLFIDVDDDDLKFFFIDTTNNDSITSYLNAEILTARIDDNFKIIIEPKPNKFGNEIIIIAASDYDQEPNATHELEVIIEPVNDPPQIKKRFNQLFFFGEIRFDEDTGFSDLNLNDVFWDIIENEPLTFTVSGNTNVLVEIAQNGSVNISAESNWYGVEELTFTATDPPGGWVSNVLKVVVEPVNDAPILNSSSSIICYEESWTNLTFDAWDPADNDQLIFSTNIGLALNLKPEDYSFDQYTGELKLYPPNRIATGEEYIVTVWVHDIPILGKSITDTKEYSFIIRNEWDKPKAKIIQPKNGDVFLDSEEIEFIGLCMDDDLKVPQLEESITYEWYSDQDGKIGEKEVTRNVLLTPGKAGLEHKITLKVSDGKFVSFAYIKISISKEEERKDSDGDGIPDYWESRHGFNKFDSSDADGDPDKDNFTNLEEYWGMDGQPYTPDSTDPWDAKDHPDRHEPDKIEEKTDYFLPGVGLLIVILVLAVLIIVTSSFVTRKVGKFRDYAEQRRQLEDRLRKEAREEEEINYGIYKAKNPEVLCHKCGERNKVKSSQRPLAVTCSQCKTRGVVY
jgi:hypothetical protein